MDGRGDGWPGQSIPLVSQTQLLSGSGEDARATRHLEALNNREIRVGWGTVSWELAEISYMCARFCASQNSRGSYYGHFPYKETEVKRDF